MAKILCVDDFPLYAEMIGAMLKQKGKHQVKVDTVPLVIDEIRAYAPDLIVVNLVRKLDALTRGMIHDFYCEVDGAKAFRALSEAKSELDIPIVVTALAVLEVEVPKDLDYEAFIEVPQKLEVLMHTIDRVLLVRKHNSPLPGR